jgi:hypothetical protein
MAASNHRQRWDLLRVDSPVPAAMAAMEHPPVLGLLGAEDR